MSVKSLTVVSVPVSDQDRARDFYVTTLGFTLIRDDASVPGLRWIQVAPETGGTALVLVTWFDTMPAGSLRGLVMACDDLDETYRRLHDAGVRFDGPPQEQGYAKEAVCYDPDGNMLVLQQA